MKTQNEFLFPLRKKRDELYDRLILDFEDDVGDTRTVAQVKTRRRAILTAALTGDVEPVKADFFTPETDDDCAFWGDMEMDDDTQTDLEAFYNVCLQIKLLESRLYDQAMKGR